MARYVEGGGLSKSLCYWPTTGADHETSSPGLDVRKEAARLTLQDLTRTVERMEKPPPAASAPSRSPGGGELWVRDAKRFCAASLTPSADGDLAKIHIAFLRREFLLAAREKDYHGRLAEPLERPRSRDSRTFLRVLLSVVGQVAKQSQCVINGVNQIGVIGYAYKRPTADDYAKVANDDVNDINHDDNKGLMTMTHYPHQQQPWDSQNDDLLRSSSSSSKTKRPLVEDDDDDDGDDEEVPILLPEAKCAKNTTEDDASTSSSFSPPPVRGARNASIAAFYGGDCVSLPQDQRPLYCADPLWWSVQLPQKLEFAVKTFRAGAKHQLRKYNLGALRNSPAPSEAAFPDLARIADGYRRQKKQETNDDGQCDDDHCDAARDDAGGNKCFDVVALGLLCLGPFGQAPYALRTLTATEDGTVVRLSNAATESRLPIEYLDFHKVMGVFESQLLPLCRKLFPSAAFVAVEVERGSANHRSYVERGLPVVDALDGSPKGAVLFEEVSATSSVVNLKAPIPAYVDAPVLAPGSPPGVPVEMQQQQPEYAALDFSTRGTTAILPQQQQQIWGSPRSTQSQALAFGTMPAPAAIEHPPVERQRQWLGAQQQQVQLTCDTTTAPKTPPAEKKRPASSARKNANDIKPPWIDHVTRWASAVLKPSPHARLHVSKLRDEFLLHKARHATDDGIDYDELAKLFSLPKSHESRIFTVTVLSVVGFEAKRQQCVISGVNQCGIIGFQIVDETNHERKKKHNTTTNTTTTNNTTANNTTTNNTTNNTTTNNTTTNNTTTNNTTTNNTTTNNTTTNTTPNHRLLNGVGGFSSPPRE